MTQAINLQITRKLLERLLRLPPDARIAGVNFDNIAQMLEIRIEHPDLPNAYEGFSPLAAKPTESTYDNGPILEQIRDQMHPYNNLTIQKLALRDSDTYQKEISYSDPRHPCD